jgi:hypothetical protein
MSYAGVEARLLVKMCYYKCARAELANCFVFSSFASKKKKKRNQNK